MAGLKEIEMSEVLVSIVIATYNRKLQLLRCLKSIENQTFKHFEVIVIDDCSGEKVLEKDISHSFPLTIINNIKNKGPAYSRNLGIKMAQSDFILFTDDDCIPHTKWVQIMYSSILNATENIAGFAGLTLAKNDDIYSRYYEHRGFLNPTNIFFETKKVTSIVTANCIIKKIIIEEVGLFNECNMVAGGEDLDLFYKITKLKYDFLFQADAIVYHDYKIGLSGMWNMLYRYGIGQAFVSYPESFRQIEYDYFNIGDYKDNDNISWFARLTFKILMKLARMSGNIKGFFIK